MNTEVLVFFAIAVIILLIYILMKFNKMKMLKRRITFSEDPPIPKHLELTYGPTQLIHKFCPHQDMPDLESLGLEKKDSFDDRLDELAKKLAEKEGHLKISKSKLRETEYIVTSLPAEKQDVKVKYRSILTSLKTDMRRNERECKKLQEQIEWVSRRRAEIQGEIRKSECHSECGGLLHRHQS